MACDFETCEKLFLKITMYWRSMLFGFLGLLTLGSGVWAWTWAEVTAKQDHQDYRIEQIEKAFDDIAFVREQSDDILDNQKKIIDSQEKIIKYIERK